jgi:uncharacterized protein GlcG (DUF336 family)
VGVIDERGTITCNNSCNTARYSIYRAGEHPPTASNSPSKSSSAASEKKEEEANEDAAERRQHIQTIQSAAKTLQFIKQGGEPILSLPEAPSEKGKKKETQ